MCKPDAAGQPLFCIPGLDGVIDAARQPGVHAPQKATIGLVADWLVIEGAQAGLDLTRYRHMIDGSAIRHVIKNHYDPRMERCFILRNRSLRRDDVPGSVQANHVK